MLQLVWCWLVLTRVNCAQTAGQIDFIFVTQVGVGYRNIMLDRHPNCPQNRGVRGPKVLGSMGKYRKISGYRDEILSSGYRETRKHVGQIWAWFLSGYDLGNRVGYTEHNFAKYFGHLLLLLLDTLHTQYASAQYCDSCYSLLVGWVVGNARTLWHCGQTAGRISDFWHTG